MLKTRREILRVVEDNPEELENIITEIEISFGEIADLLTISSTDELDQVDEARRLAEDCRSKLY